MAWLPWLVLVVAAYLMGSLSFSLLVVRLLRGIDLREVGSGNAGATNVLRTAGPIPALLVLLLDISKGVVPVVVARALDAPGPVVGGAAAAAVCGHIYPLFFGFRGGKGVATITGALATLAPVAALLSALIFVLAVVTTRWVSLGSVSAIGFFPLLVWVSGRSGWTEPAEAWLLLTAALLAALVVYKHRANIARILAGTESRLGQRVAGPVSTEGSPEAGERT